MFLFPNALFTSHQGQSGGRGLSPRLWNKVNTQMLSPDGITPGSFIWEDFKTFGIGTAVASNVGYYVGQAGAWYSFEDTGAAIAQLATEKDGAIKQTVDADDNQEVWLQLGNATSVCGVITDTAGSERLLIFEARFKPKDVVGNRFIGLAEEGSAAGDFMTDAGVMKDCDWIGFYAEEDAPTILHFGYKKNGQTRQEIITTGLQTLAADTWYKVGFVYDPAEVASKRIKIFVDNEEKGTYVTATNIAAATFPDGEEMAPIVGVKNVTDIMEQHVDWVAFFQAG